MKAGIRGVGISWHGAAAAEKHAVLRKRSADAAQPDHNLLSRNAGRFCPDPMPAPVGSLSAVQIPGCRCNFVCAGSSGPASAPDCRMPPHTGEDPSDRAPPLCRSLRYKNSPPIWRAASSYNAADGTRTHMVSRTILSFTNHSEVSGTYWC